MNSPICILKNKNAVNLPTRKKNQIKIALLMNYFKHKIKMLDKLFQKINGKNNSFLSYQARINEILNQVKGNPRKEKQCPCEYRCKNIYQKLAHEIQQHVKYVILSGIYPRNQRLL